MIFWTIKQAYYDSSTSWTLSFITRLWCLVFASTFSPTIFGLFDYCSFSNLSPLSTGLGTWFPTAPRGPLTIHFGCLQTFVTRFATIPFHPGCVLSTTVSIIQPLPAAPIFILTWFYPRQKETFCKMKLISAFEGKNNVEKDQMPSTIKNILISINNHTHFLLDLEA